jgi:hypothetical protein
MKLSSLPLVLAVSTSALVGAAAGCSAGGASSAAPDGAGGAANLGPGAAAAGAVLGSAAGSTGEPPTITPIMTVVGGGADGGACKAVVQQAEKQTGRADIVFVLDNSGSMGQEVSAVQSNLNTFSSQITSSGIDVHVVVISAPPMGGPGGGACVDPTGIACVFVPGLTVGGLINGNGVCVDPPLGTQGACPQGDDSNAATGFLHVKQAVDSHNALAMVEQTYPNWQQILRPDAAKTFVVITDDESQVAAPDFTTWVNGQPLFQSGIWRFSGIFCTAGSVNCANVGTTYQTLVTQTAGVAGNLGELSDGQVDAQFKAVFDSLAKAVVKDARPVDCQWGIPAPPDGQTLDPQAVNVRYTTSVSTNTTIYGVDGADKCTDMFGGWYYDNPAAPAHVQACPQTCKILQADLSTKVEVLFGCARQTPPIR